MNTDKYNYNLTEYQDEPDEYKTTMRLDIKHLEPEDFGTYQCLSQPGVQGQTTQHIRLFGKLMWTKKGIESMPLESTYSFI